MNFENERIWIIGASNGIGRELAIQLSQLGAELLLSARNKKELQSLKEELESKSQGGQSHKIYPLDASNYKEIVKSAQELNRHGKLDRVIFMAAIYNPGTMRKLDMAYSSKIIDVNIKGALHTIHASLPIFYKQKKGQIVLCGSLAGYIGLPNGQPYSATKAAIINLAESLAAETPKYINVKLISPGFVQTRLVEKNQFKMPMIIEVSQAARYIIKGLNKRHFEIYFPKRMNFIIKFVRMLPYSIQEKLVKQLEKLK